ncbi:MAG: patatin-like phospholipase family protein [Candidatus Izemoplasmataceae bacterium]
MARKRGIALAGGGARGAYQIGVLKALKETGYLKNIHAVSGASVGSLNAVFIAMDALDEAESLWLSMDEDTLFSTSDTNFIERVLEDKFDLFHKGLYSTEKLEKLIDKYVDYEAVKKSKIFVATSYVGDEDTSFIDLMSLNLRNFFSAEEYVRYPLLSTMSNDMIKKTLLASCALPVAFKPVKIDGKTYYDGGILDNTPYKPLLDAGCDEIIIIDLFRFNFRRRRQIEDTRMLYFYPSKSIRGVMDFSHEQITRRFELGYHDTFERLREIEEEDKRLREKEKEKEKRARLKRIREAAKNEGTD